MNRATRPSRPGLTGSASKSLLLSAAAGGVVLKAAPDTTTSTSLTWNEPEYKPDNYRVERSLDGTTFSTVTTLANTVFTYTDTGRTESTQYWYRIVPILGGADQPASNVADTWTVPATPTTLTATAVSGTQINLAWTDVSTGNTGYVIEGRRPPTTGAYSVIGTAGATATTFSATGLITGTAYEFRVAATNPVTQSAYSNAATATTQALPAAPTGVSASASTTAVAVTITWTDASTDEDNFNVYRNTSNTTVGATLLNSPLAGIQTYTDNATNNPSAPPAIGTTYYYWVSASNGVGESAKTAASQNATGGVTTLNVPAAPTSLTATAASSTQINLAWTDNATNETSYIVERRSPAGTGSYSQITSLAAGSTTFSNTGLTASTQYEYRVAATNAAGNSAYSNAASATTASGTYNVEYLVVAGGGGGAKSAANTAGGGGGGAGGYTTATGFSLNPGTSYTITVGAGGGSAAAGNNSVFSTITSNGGGAGGTYGGGSSGGGTFGVNAGGGGGSGYPWPGGGGGGAGGAGGSGSGATIAGDGGAGRASSITGTAVTRAGGGGGSLAFGSGGSGEDAGAGGSGGGGKGAGEGSGAVAGTANTGSGGGAGSYYASNGAAGGSGIVILRMATANYSGTTTGSPTVTTSGSDTILTYNASGTYTA